VVISCKYFTTILQTDFSVSPEVPDFPDFFSLFHLSFAISHLPCIICAGEIK